MQTYQKRACILVFLLILLFAGSSVFLLQASQRSEKDAALTALLYQNGDLIDRIDLDQVTESYQFTVTGDQGCSNVVEVRKGSIGIVSADCPDKLCVHQGFLDNTSLPITCLPNRLVIRLEAISEETDTSPEIDIITH